MPRDSRDVKVGDIIKLTDDAVDNYGRLWWGRRLTVTCVSRSSDEHPGYDEGAGGGPLIDCAEAGFSLYDWEFTIVG